MGRETDEEHETSSDDDTNSIQDIENELYSIVYYTGLNENTPNELLKKYNIKKNSNELIISLKSTEEENNEFDTVEEEHETEITIENRKSGTGKDVNYNSKEIECVQISDAESDCLIIDTKMHSNNLDVPKDPTFKKHATTPKGNSNIPVVSLSDDNSDIVINTEEPKECVIVSDSESDTFDNGKNPTFKLTKSNWKEICSPETWTHDMKKYYNSPSQKLKSFNHYTIRNKMKVKRANWFINDLDKFPDDIPRPRCLRCRGRGHMIKECPLFRRNCHMCGLSGHSESKCPDRMCLNCGNISPVFLTMCDKCISGSRNKCAVCHKKGHYEETCPDVWRRYHSTISGPIQQTSTKLKEKKHCCNCAEEGHLYEHCTKMYWSTYPKAYSYVTNYEGEHNVRKTTRIYLPGQEQIGNEEVKRIIKNYQNVGVKIVPFPQQHVAYLEVHGTVDAVTKLRSDIFNALSKSAGKPVEPPGKKNKKKNFWRQKKSFL